ncbi:MAG: hypothetical protein K6T83_11510 [Alicyclobacillus sp.]|nr:hypothetical protein [Alicyclobacillus sp.]
MPRRMAHIPEQPLVYADMTLREHLEWKRRLWQATLSDVRWVEARLEEDEVWMYAYFMGQSPDGLQAAWP